MSPVPMNFMEKEYPKERLRLIAEIDFHNGIEQKILDFINEEKYLYLIEGNKVYLYRQGEE